MSVELAGRLSTRAVSAEIEAECPGVTAWHGHATGTWWALVPVRKGSRLVEAVNPGELRQAIRNAGTWPWPRLPLAGGRVGAGRWP